ncbi:hypothetical protein ACNAN0_04645 [Agrilactobacillus fermenti]|uniref:hypothetical protein n=1 Tax=Agrilactobacillus fermenti TaxID=2586909 RepID=UPI001E288458|nr:hypothetical protein [Agrilactobacillus fermenti]MCD2256712.1 hypothetical protein [Agrilactobacillus fermenti]
MGIKDYVGDILKKQLTIRKILSSRVQTELFPDCFVISMKHAPEESTGLSFEDVQILDCIVNLLGMYGVKFTSQMFLYDRNSKKIDTIKFNLQLSEYEIINNGLKEIVNSKPTN